MILAARGKARAGYAIRKEVPYTLADVRSAHTHYLLKVANVVADCCDRKTRARAAASGTVPMWCGKPSKSVGTMAVLPTAKEGY